MMLLARSQRSPKPWKNGLGVTEDVLSATLPSSGELAWKISLATIDRSAPFSHFPGIDRMLMPISADGLSLEIDGVVNPVPQFAVVTFPGEAPVAATRVTRTQQDLNVMASREGVRATLSHRYIVGTTGMPTVDEGEIVVVVALSPTIRHNSMTLRVGDALLLEPGSRDLLGGYGHLAVARIVAPFESSTNEGCYFPSAEGDPSLGFP